MQLLSLLFSYILERSCRQKKEEKEAAAPVPNPKLGNEKWELKIKFRKEKEQPPPSINGTLAVQRSTAENCNAMEFLTTFSRVSLFSNCELRNRLYWYFKTVTCTW